MRVLITGATGLVGLYATVQCLRQGKVVRALVRDETKLAECLKPFDVDTTALEIRLGDITDQTAVTAAIKDCDALIHCAGIFSDRLQDSEHLKQINVKACQQVLEAAATAQLDPIVHISSYLALFPPQGDRHSAADEITTPASMYARTKASAERIARNMQDKGLPVVTVYPASVQGPFDPTYSIGSVLLEQAIRNGWYLTTEGGRSFTDVRDLAHLLHNLLEPGRGARRIMCGGYYLTYEEQRQLLEKVSGVAIKARAIPGGLLRAMGSVADAISRITGKQFSLTREAAEVLTRSVPCDDAPGLADPGYKRVGAEQSFRDLVDWMKDTKRLTL